MRKTALAALLSIGFAPAALAQDAAAPAEGPATERADIPAEGEATLADCQVWLDQLGELIQLADPPITEEALAEADARHDEVAQACEDGEYHQGIVMAADTIEMIEQETAD